jgi:predicted RNA binding protein YcfA (HicA-like mRNA interferase family)
MPRKIRMLVRDLKRAGFENRGGKGSHRNFLHPPSGARVTVSGKDGDDAKPYQEKEVRDAVETAGSAAKGAEKRSPEG